VQGRELLKDYPEWDTRFQEILIREFGAPVCGGSDEWEEFEQEEQEERPKRGRG